MTRRALHNLWRYLGDQTGAAMIEFAVVMLLFFLMFFAVIDYGRLGGAVVMNESAAQIAARIAVVRPPACAGVPKTNARGSATTLERNGTSCRYDNGSGSTCADPGPISCTGDAANITANEIWTRVSPILPPGTTIANMSYEYRFDSQMGYLGGPYTPMVTVSITPPNFQFVSPIGAIASTLGATGTWNNSVPYKTVSASMPAEDLAHGAE